MSLADSGLSQQLWDLAQGARWFSARDAQLDSLELGNWAHPGLRTAFLNTVGPRGRERFFVPLSYRGAQPIDACDDGGLLLEALIADAPGFTRLADLPSGLAARRYRGEQSNTTIFFADQALAKVYRRLEPGRNVEVELHQALAGAGVAAELLGTWSQAGVDLAIFLEVLPDAQDGYVLACQYAQQSRPFDEHAHALGAVLAKLHQVLAQRLGSWVTDPAKLVASWQNGWELAAAEVPQLASAKHAVNAFAAVGSSPIVTQRIHGDCHLGQALLSGGRWVLVDFEGEPLKPLAERRSPDSPLRDVAGMLRSFDYAAHAGQASKAWLVGCREAFLAGYGISAVDPLLKAYETDKAAYEARYEARHRPQLLAVPLNWLSNSQRPS